MLKPIFTEKSIMLAKLGQYSFWVGRMDTKAQIKSEIKKVFGVNVVAIRTINAKGESGKNNRGRKFLKPTLKKAIVILKDKEKLDLYEKT